MPSRRIFISYDRNDERVVTALVAALEQGGHEVWWDEEFSGGAGWWEAVLAQVREATIVVLALSGSSARSARCQAEREYAQALGIPVLTVQVGRVRVGRVERRCAGQRVFDFREPDSTDAVVLLLDVAEAAARRGPLPVPLPAPPPVPGAGVFISYRRGDSQHAAGRLRSELVPIFSDDRVFLDIDSIQPGADFTEAIDDAVGRCGVLLALIGPVWLSAVDEDGRTRLQDPHDVVVAEIDAALRRDIRVIPVLLDGARMPRRAELPPSIQNLAGRNGVPVDHSTFRSDLEPLVAAIRRVVDEEM